MRGAVADSTCARLVKADAEIFVSLLSRIAIP
jgi:hypothetical protein